METPLSDPDAWDAGPDIASLRDVTGTIERRMLRLITEGTRKVVSLADMTSELTLLAKDVKRCYARAADLRERRDVSFGAHRALQEIGHQCIWLYRRLHLEQVFFQKLHLEMRLRAVLSAEARQIYEELLDVDYAGKEFETQSDAEIGRVLLERDDDGTVRPHPRIVRRTALL